MFPDGLDDGERLVRRKWLLDGLKDPKHKKYDAAFRVEVEFSRTLPPQVRTSQQQQLGAQL